MEREGSLIYLILMIVVVFVVDYRFLRRDAMKRLVVNGGIVLVFLAVYLAFLNHP